MALGTSVASVCKSLYDSYRVRGMETHIQQSQLSSGQTSAGFCLGVRVLHSAMLSDPGGRCGDSRIGMTRFL